MTRLAIGTGISQATDVSWLSVDLDPLPLTLSLTGGEVEISASPEGQLSISISGTSIYNGVYIVDPADLHAGPVNLAPPVIIGPPETGAVLAAQPGLWIYETAATPPVESYVWLRDGAPISAATGSTYTMGTEDAGAVLSVVEQLTDTTGTHGAESAGLMVPAATRPLAVSRIGGFQSSGIGTAAPAFPVDLGDYAAGDIVLVFYGTNTYADAAWLDDLPFQKISVDAGSTGAGKVTAFAHTLTGPGSAAATITVDLPSASNAHVFSAHGIRNGVLSQVEAVQSATGGTLSLSVTPTTDRNTVLACAMGVSFMDDVFTWTGVDAVETATVPTATRRNISLAERRDVALSPHAVTGTPSAASHTGIIAVAISEA